MPNMIIQGYIGPICYEDLRLSRQDPKDWRVQRMSVLELLGFVSAVADGHIFLAEHVSPFDDMAYVFPAVSFLLEITEQARREIGTFYEFIDQATGRARNGQPSFATVRFIHREDWLHARDLIAAKAIRGESLKQ